MVGLPSAKVTHLPKEAPPTYQTKLNRDGSCGLRRRASTHRHPPPRRRFGRAASPRRSGGRQLILYLKVAIAGQASCTGRRMVGAPGRTSTPGRPAKSGQRAPGRFRSQAHRKNPTFAAGLSSGVLCVWPFGRGVQTARPCKIVPPNQAIPHRQGSLLHSKACA